jgi:hypothetical protein
MQNTIKNYFRSYPKACRIATGSVSPLFLTFGTIDLFLDFNYSTILMLLAGLVWLPYALISYGFLKNKGISLRLIDLSTYYFGTKTIAGDLNIDEHEAKTLDTMLKIAILAEGPTVQPAVVARKLVETYDIPAASYMYLIVRAAVLLGRNKGESQLGNLTKDLLVNKDEQLFRERLDKIKKKIEEDVKKRKPDSDEPNNGSKYGWL